MPIERGCSLFRWLNPLVGLPTGYFWPSFHLENVESDDGHYFNRGHRIFLILPAGTVYIFEHTLGQEVGQANIKFSWQGLFLQLVRATGYVDQVSLVLMVH